MRRSESGNGIAFEKSRGMALRKRAAAGVERCCRTNFGKERSPWDNIVIFDGDVDPSVDKVRGANEPFSVHPHHAYCKPQLGGQFLCFTQGMTNIRGLILRRLLFLSTVLWSRLGIVVHPRILLTTT